MLYREVTPETFEPWNGEIFNGVRHATTIEHQWPQSELNAIGLYRPEPADPIPDGKISVSTTVKRVGGVVRYVHTLANAPAPATVSSPTLFAAVTINITDGVLSSIELAAQLQGAFYDTGWLLVGFASEQDPAKYMVFAQTDIPAKVEQYKDVGGFELIFSDSNGDPVDPSQVNVQILKVG